MWWGLGLYAVIELGLSTCRVLRTILTSYLLEQRTKKEFSEEESLFKLKLDSLLRTKSKEISTGNFLG